jgi:hypothetical protein
MQRRVYRFMEGRKSGDSFGCDFAVAEADAYVGESRSVDCSRRKRKVSAAGVVYIADLRCAMLCLLLARLNALDISFNAFAEAAKRALIVVNSNDQVN